LGATANARSALLPEGKDETILSHTSATGLARIMVTLCCLLPGAPGFAADATLGRNELPIHDAARMGTRQDVEKLLKAAPQSRDVRTELGATPLHYAALNEDSGPLLALIAAGANVNARDKEGMTPLHMAAFATRTKHALPLLQAGADPALKTAAGRDVLSMARKVRADEFAGIVSLWLLKGCKPQVPC
jgi:hypothetical protein